MAVTPYNHASQYRPMDPDKARAWGETWREQHQSRWARVEGADGYVPVPRSIALSPRALRASDLAEQVDQELGRQRGWYRNDDGFWGPYGA